MEVKNRASLAHKMRYAVSHPHRISAYAQRWARDSWLRMTTDGHVGYYRAVMRSDSAKSPEQAVGSASHDRWLALGALQFDYLLRHGLRPGHRLLEIGCGNLRAGWRFIEYLDEGNYHGIDISPDILFAAQKVLAGQGLQSKVPHLTPVCGLDFAFLPTGYFDVVHAHSVFSHSPLPVIDECLAHVGRILAPGGFFDFTFDRTTGPEHQVLREDFYYRTETLTALARRHGLDAVFMHDWEELPHKQSKLRVSVRCP
ncbi:methyltransferase family protein [Actinocorallia herbida]|uniref:Methyltransferase family protein n=1 Tax=Actinocorallia herbida TaxID=58109 RepID=A0A3N1D861_9ACTN|nr:class I SAM-dependent methyltransferase [Actinocorallia herbida]ROO89659.1 methyltransferase family protein [Actinocorallia herbida]